jgi:hypothetical protein
MLATLNGADAGATFDLAQTYHLASERDLLAGSKLELALRATMQRDALHAWLNLPKETRHD